MRLYTYFRSSAAYRVRIALALKDLSWEAVPIHLLKEGGQQRTEAYSQLNPAKLVPAFEDQGAVLNQSLAIIEYLEERYPQGARLLPEDHVSRAHVRSLALSIACDIHPLNNLRVLQYLTQDLGISEEQRKAWYLHWVGEGLEAFEKQLQLFNQDGAFCYGNRPTLADVCLIPQVFNAERFGYDLSHLPRVQAAVAACSELPAFISAAPANQSDAE